MTPYRFVLLDADNTLYDFNAAEHNALHAVLTRWGFPTDEASVNTYLQINNALWEAFARGEVAQDFLLVERFRRFQDTVGGSHDPAAINHDYVTTLGTQGILLPGALELCRKLTGLGCTLAIVTNGAAIAQRGRYDVSPIREVIPHLFISQELGVSKPDPLFFDHVCRNLGISDRKQAVMVGDSLSSDILGGNRAGIDTVWYNPDSLPLTGPARPTFTVTDYGDLFTLIHRTMSEEL